MNETDKDEMQQVTAAPEADSDTVPKIEEEGQGLPPPDQDTLASSFQQTRAELEQAKASVIQWQEEAARLQRELVLTTGKYRNVLLASAPEIPQELVQGQTVTELEASIANARQIVEHIRNQLEVRVESHRVPAGAPTRSGPELSTLSPREKIAYALGQTRG